MAKLVIFLREAQGDGHELAVPNWNPPKYYGLKKTPENFQTTFVEIIDTQFYDKLKDSRSVLWGPSPFSWKIQIFSPFVLLVFFNFLIMSIQNMVLFAFCQK